jgi:aryl-alcohol dehydrogenase-like predicted oxidoreductase
MTFPSLPNRLGLGLAALGRPGYITLGHSADLNQPAGRHTYAPDQMAAHAATVLDAAWHAGVRYYDAARSYGKAEQFLAAWLHSRAIPPAAVVVGSKWGYTYTANWQREAAVHEVKEHTLPVLQRQWGESTTLLGEWLDLYQIHSATLESGVLENRAVLDGLARIRAERGITLGLSVSGTGQAATIERALAITVDGQPLFGSVQATWNVLERSAEKTLAAAASAGWTVIVKEALANGRLTPRNDDPAFHSALALLTAQAARLHTTVDALALAAVLDQPWAAIVLSGAASVAHLRSNAAALDVRLDDEARAALATLRESADFYWQQRSALPWN